MVIITPAKEENKTPDSESGKGEDNFPDYDKQKKRLIWILIFPQIVKRNKKWYFEYSNSDVDLAEKLSEGIEATNELSEEI